MIYKENNDMILHFHNFKQSTRYRKESCYSFNYSYNNGDLSNIPLEYNVSKDNKKIKYLLTIKSIIIIIDTQNKNQFAFFSLIHPMKNTKELQYWLDYVNKLAKEINGILFQVGNDVNDVIDTLNKYKFKELEQAKKTWNVK